MAYILTGRIARTGRLSFVPGAAACAATARRFPLSFAPLQFVSSAEKQAEDLGGNNTPEFSSTHSVSPQGAN